MIMHCIFMGHEFWFLLIGEVFYLVYGNGSFFGGPKSKFGNNDGLIVSGLFVFPWISWYFLDFVCR